uniref:Uncharacterized protein n=1 Tax=Panagrellus redivivus TaxID=6233 RepID=A0A7E4V3J7_PANRE
MVYENEPKSGVFQKKRKPTAPRPDGWAPRERCRKAFEPSAVHPNGISTPASATSIARDSIAARNAPSSPTENACRDRLVALGLDSRSVSSRAADAHALD